MECSLQGSSVHGILQARILEGVAVFSPASPVSPASAGRFFTIASLEALVGLVRGLYFDDITHLLEVIVLKMKF